MKAVEWNKKEELVHDQALKHLKVRTLCELNLSQGPVVRKQINFAWD